MPEDDKPQPGTGTFKIDWEGQPPAVVTPAAPPAKLTPLGFAVKYTPFAVALMVWTFGVVTYMRTGVGPVPLPPVIPQATPDSLQLASTDPDSAIMTFGWVPDQLAVQAVVGQEQIAAFGDTPAGKSPEPVRGEGEVFQWEAVRKCLQPAQPYPNVNQRDVGCCVGAGFKHASDALQAIQIVGGKPGEFRPASVEAIYGGSRVEVGGGRLSGDGSVGAWAAKYLKNYGVLPMQRYPLTGSPVVADLTTFSPAKAREWGRTGVPNSLEALAREHPVKGIAQVRTWEECRKALTQGYPVTVCSDQGFTMKRDANAFCSPQGSWAHCMCILGVRGGTRPGGFVLNSWGDQAHTGPVYPASMPLAGFWADASVIDRMLSQGDSYALSEAVGFPAKKLDWSFAAAPKPADPAGVFAAHLAH